MYCFCVSIPKYVICSWLSLCFFFFFFQYLFWNIKLFYYWLLKYCIILPLIIKICIYFEAYQWITCSFWHWWTETWLFHSKSKTQKIELLQSSMWFQQKLCILCLQSERNGTSLIYAFCLHQNLWYFERTNNYNINTSIYIHSLPKIKHGEENGNFRKPIRIQEDAVHCRGRWKYSKC